MRIGEAAFKVTIRHPDGTMQEVTIIAQSSVLAQRMAEAQYGKNNIVRVLPT